MNTMPLEDRHIKNEARGHFTICGINRWIRVKYSLLPVQLVSSDIFCARGCLMKVAALWV